MQALENLFYNLTRQKNIVMLNFDYMKKIILPLLIILSLACPCYAQENGAAEGMPSNIMATPEFQAVQAQVTENPEIVGDIENLLDDPEIMSIISDPTFIAAVQSGDMASLESNPRLQRLLEHPAIQAIIEKVKLQQ
jgi:hypothetical protein